MANLEKYPLPRMEDMHDISSLAKEKVFTKLGLTNENMLAVEAGSGIKGICTISTHKGLLQYNRLPFACMVWPQLQPFFKTITMKTSCRASWCTCMDNIFVGRII